MTQEAKALNTNQGIDENAWSSRRIGSINALGLWTLYCREVNRFLKVFLQTVIAPAVTTLLFLVIFTVALGRGGREVVGIPFASFLAPGLIAMAVLQNAFANTSSSLLIGKVQGTILDLLMPPLSSFELMLGFVGGAVTRGVMVAIAVAIPMIFYPGVDIGIAHPLILIYFIISAATMMALAGLLTAIWAEKFDHAAAVQNFIIQPLSLLSGTFYSISVLAPSWQMVSHANPFFYLIDGVRYGMLGHSDGDITLGIWVILGLNLALWTWAQYLFKSGYKLRA
ncbi:MAG: ABC transporter permease [Sphingomonadales bacterium]